MEIMTMDVPEAPEIAEDEEKRAERKYYIAKVLPKCFPTIRLLRDEINRLGIEEDEMILYGRIIAIRKRVEISYDIG